MAQRCGGVTRSVLGCARSRLNSTGNSFRSVGERSSSCRTAFRDQSTFKRQRFSIYRLPVEMAGAQSLIPLHSAVAAARLTSRLSINSRSLSQGMGSWVLAGLDPAASGLWKEKSLNRLWKMLSMWWKSCDAIHMWHRIAGSFGTEMMVEADPWLLEDSIVSLISAPSKHRV